MVKMKRFELNFDEDKINDIFNKYGASYDLKECCKLLNKLNDECKFLADQRDYWKQKYEEGTETFTLKCYDSKEDLIDGLINENEQLKETNKQLREINKKLIDDLYNCRLNKNIISEKLKILQDTLIKYDIYTIKDLSDSFELDAKTNKEKDKKIKQLQVKVLNLELELMKNE